MIDFILSGSTKYYEPLSCGVRSCDFGATCIKSDCLCEFDCQNGDSYYKEPVCGNDGNTYRTECQLRQYSCRIQKEIIIVKYEPCTDAPRAVYGQDSRQQDILSDGTGTITVYGLIGDQCLDDRDCFIDSTSCIEGTVSGSFITHVLLKIKHTLILSDCTLKEKALSSFAFQHC